MAKILIVEDDDLLRMAFSRQLAGAGHEVCQAADAVAAVTVGVRERPELVLLDLGLPAGSGITVLQRLRALPATALVEALVVTGGMLDYDSEEELTALGCVAVLTKPVVSADLVSAVEKALEGSAPAVPSHG